MVDFHLMREFLDHSSIAVSLALTPEGIVEDCNQALAALLGFEREDLVGRDVRELFAANDAANIPGLAGRDVEPGTRFLLNFVDAADIPHTVECRMVEVDDRFVIYGEPMQASEDDLRNRLLEMNNLLAVQARESARKSAALEKALEDLERSHWHIRKIQEVLPICMECGDVKNETGWESVVEYLKKNTRFLSHGYCPDCLARLRASNAFGLGHGGSAG